MVDDDDVVNVSYTNRSVGERRTFSLFFHSDVCCVGALLNLALTLAGDPPVV